MNREQIFDNYNRQIERIEASRVYSDHAKKVMAAKAYTAAQGALEELRQQEVKAIEGRREQLQRKMFGRENTADAQTVIARREANDRAAKLDNPRVAAEQLRTAVRQGDHTMAQAIAQQAATFNWSDVLEAYADHQPGFRENVEEFNQLPDTSGGSNWGLQHGLSHVLPMPSILGHVSPAQAHGYAEQDLEGDAA